MKTWTKTFIAAVLASILLAGLAGCGQVSTGTEPETEREIQFSKTPDPDVATNTADPDTEQVNAAESFVEYETLEEALLASRKEAHSTEIVPTSETFTFTYNFEDYSQDEFADKVSIVSSYAFMNTDGFICYIYELLNNMDSEIGISANTNIVNDSGEKATDFGIYDNWQYILPGETFICTGQFSDLDVSEKNFSTNIAVWDLAALGRGGQGVSSSWEDYMTFDEEPEDDDPRFIDLTYTRIQDVDGILAGHIVYVKYKNGKIDGYTGTTVVLTDSAETTDQTILLGEEGIDYDYYERYVYLYITG